MKYQNITGKRIQHENRLSESFNWGAKDRVEILSECESYGRPGYILINLEFGISGAATSSDLYHFEQQNPEMKGWISKELFEKSFKALN
jgi:hypothetical protein